MNENFVDIPEPLITYEDLYKRFRNSKIHLNIRYDIIDLMFKEFWDLCDTPIPVAFKYKNAYFITRNKERISEVIRMSEYLRKSSIEEMKFVELKTIPVKNAERGSKDWLSFLIKIPVEKAWTPKIKGVQTIKAAINKLVKEKKLIEGQYTVCQRTVNKVVTIYVANNGIPKKN